MKSILSISGVILAFFIGGEIGGCHRLESHGVITGKSYEGEYYTTIMVPVFNGNTVTMTPQIQYFPPCWYLNVDFSGESRRVGVGEGFWRAKNIGESISANYSVGGLTNWAYSVEVK